MGTTVQIPLKNNRLMNDKLFFMVVKNVLERESNKYRKDIHYKNPIDDSMILKICKEDEEITITRHGDNEVVIKIHAKEEVAKEFLKEMAIEAATIICNDICINAFTEEDELKNSLHQQIKQGIENTFKECQ